MSNRGDYRGREPDEDPYGTCDWGYCDAEATQWRYSPGVGWLPVCDGCAWLADSEWRRWLLRQM